MIFFQRDSKPGKKMDHACNFIPARENIGKPFQNAGKQENDVGRIELYGRVEEADESGRNVRLKGFEDSESKKVLKV